MRIIVCVKQVPEPEALGAVDAGGEWRNSLPADLWRMNRYDECALEEALRLKESLSGLSVDVLTVGPPGSKSVIVRALGMGADHGIHIQTEAPGYRSPFTIAEWISYRVKSDSYDLVFTGAVSEDQMNGQVGPMIAEILSLPCATFVVSAEVSARAHTVRGVREIEGGYREIVELRLPAVLTIQTGPNPPRYPSLSNMLRAKKQIIETIDACDLPQSDCREELVDIDEPDRSRSGLTLEGTTEDKARRLIEILAERAFVR